MDADTVGSRLAMSFQAQSNVYSKHQTVIFSVTKPVNISNETVIQKCKLLSHSANIFPYCNANVTIIHGLLALLMS